MKLLVKTNLINILLAGIFLLLGGVIIYKLTTSTISEETTEKLIDNKDRIVDRIKNEQPVGSIPPILEIQKIGHLPVKKLVVVDTVLLDPISEDKELFREVTSYETINFQNYRITVRQIILEPHDYINNVQQGLLFAWIFSIVGLLIIYWIISKSIWRPFKKNIAILKKFKVTDQDRIQFHKTTTSEFKQLNRAMEELTEKVRSDYRSLKEFTENAAHEIQTPLMIIQTKLEDALQYPNLNPEVGTKIKASIESSNRLSKLIQTLLLLAKIENNQFNKKESVDMRICIKSVLINLDDFIASRNLHVEAQLEPISVVTDPLLAEVLVTNLITNAIRYNVQDGNIEIALSNKGLKVVNPSNDHVKNPEVMFDRFAKGSQAASSHGLGLAIVKKICDQHDWKVIYSVKDNQHILEILF